MPSPSNPAARLVLDFQRTRVADQSIGGQVHGAPTIHERHHRREGRCKPSTTTSPERRLKLQLTLEFYCVGE
jgi:hypothetical protein